MYTKDSYYFKLDFPNTYESDGKLYKSTGRVSKTYKGTGNVEVYDIESNIIFLLQKPYFTKNYSLVK